MAVGYCTVRLGTARYCGYCRVLGTVGTAGVYCRVLQGPAGYCRVLQGTTERTQTLGFECRT